MNRNKVKADFTLPVGKKMILQADDKKYSRGLLVELLKNKSYNISYWYGDEAKPYPIEVLVDGKSVSKDAKKVTMKFHPELKKSGEPMDIVMRLLKEKKPDPRLKAAGVSGYNKPKRTPKHPKKSHVVVARSGGKVKTIRFGEQGADTVTEDNPKGKRAKKRASFKARHQKNIRRGPMSAAYWADKVKW
tara:strand:+ start:1211 stop:1777 length:567 start_codon:yes stop_codon:yes gene_type:complete